MRIRTILLIIGIVLLAGFTALNIDEFSRSSLLSLGFTTIDVPLGLVMLLLLVVAVVIFLASTLYMQSQNLIETRKYARELQAQRELADKAEASRFTELQHYIESQNLAAENRQVAAHTVLNEKLAQTQAALLTRLEESDSATAAYLGELEDRLDRRDGVVVPATTTIIRDPG
ncbi:MAG: hypothetical protein Q7T87_09660 [Polaromonas sp.]|nr:hypothetical protein [Polaromonas sp.]